MKNNPVFTISNLAPYSVTITVLIKSDNYSYFVYNITTEQMIAFCRALRNKDIDANILDDVHFFLNENLTEKLIVRRNDFLVKSNNNYAIVNYINEFVLD